MRRPSPRILPKQNSTRSSIFGTPEKKNRHQTDLHPGSDKGNKRIDLVYSRSELEDFFRKTIGLYLEWLRKIAVHEETRNKSIAGLAFPFPEYREGQRELMGACYRTLMNKGILYAIAPTGSGNGGCSYSSLKTIHQAGQNYSILPLKISARKLF